MICSARNLHASNYFRKECSLLWYERVTLRPGSSGPPVAALRRLLRRRGGDGLHAAPTRAFRDDEPYDDALANAVAKLQTEHGLTPDGIVGPATWRLLLGAANHFVADGNSPWGPSASGHAVHVHVSLQQRRLALHVWHDGDEGGRWDVHFFPVGIGRAASPTQPGTYSVRELVSNPGPPLGTRWIRLQPDVCSIHGTDEPWTIGHATTCGCIRMYNKDVEFVFHRLTPRTPVIIE